MNKSSKTTNVKTANRAATGLAVAVMALIAMLSMSVGQTAAEVVEDDSIWSEIDGGSLGVAATPRPVNAACWFDAGSLGIENPVEACATHEHE